MGGLTVRAAIARALPGESLVYFGDGKNVPYGPRPAHEIIKFAGEAIEKLVNEHNAKMIVVACNAATGAAIDHLRAKYTEPGTDSDSNPIHNHDLNHNDGPNHNHGPSPKIPIIGMEPAVKPAALTTKTGTIGILATAAAFRGDLYKTTAAKYADKIKILETIGEGFVELVETDRENTPEADEIIAKALVPMLQNGADRIVLGCTHYPFLAPRIQILIDRFAEKTGCPAARIIDSAPARARRVDQLMTENGLRADTNHSPKHLFLSFADENYLRHLARKSEKVPQL
jgi:glutamate racemase